MPEILKSDANSSEKEIISRAVEILADGGIIAYPTETFYGLGADATNKKSIEKIFSVKGRDFKNPISLIIGKRDDIYSLVKDVPESAKKLMDTFWPGALTIVFAASDKVLPALTAGSGKIGLRISSHPIAQAIVQKLKNRLPPQVQIFPAHRNVQRRTKLSNKLAIKLMLLGIGEKLPAARLLPLLMLPVLQQLSCAKER